MLPRAVLAAAAAAAGSDAPPGSASQTLTPASGTWWVESSLARVMPQSTMPTTPTWLDENIATIHMAGNEHESFQVALRPAANTT